MQQIPAYNVVELIDAGEHNPYHVFMYMIVNFQAVDYTKPVIYYYPNKKNCRVSEELLSLLPPNFIRHTEKKEGLNYYPFLYSENIFGGRLPVHYRDFTLPHNYDFIRMLYKPHIMPAPNKDIRVYITRNQDSASRHVLNELELIQGLIPLGFHVIKMTDLSLREQIYLYSSADIIVTPHGANMSFMLFSHPETTIFELNCGGERHYSHIAWHYGIDYFRIKCRAEGEHMNVDVRHVLRLLEAHPKIWRDDSRSKAAL